MKSKRSRRKGAPDEASHSLWRWTAVLIHALRQALCPSPGILALVAESTRGELHQRLSDGKRKRQTQATTLRTLLKDWILG